MLAEHLLLVALDGGVGADGEPGLDLVVGVDLRGEALVDVLVAAGHTVLVDIVEGQEVRAAVVAALGAEGVVVRVAHAVEDVGPVGVGHAVPGAVGDELLGGAEQAGGVLPVDVLLRVHDLGMVAEAVDGELIIIEDGTVLALGAALGGDEHDTVAGLRAVDGGGGGVLQDFHGLDHRRIEVVDVLNLQAVHDEERAEAGAAVGGDTADADRGTLARGAGSVEDLDAGSLALEGGGGVGGGTVSQVGGLDGCHGSREVALLLDAVADDDRLFQHLGIVFEDDVEGGLVAHHDRLALVADTLDGDGGAGGDVQRERTVDVGSRTDLRVAHDHDGGADDRQSAGVNDRTADGAGLCECLRASAQGEEQHQDT